MYKLVGYANIIQPQTRKFCDKAIILCIESRLDEIDQLYPSLLLRPGFEQLLFASPDSSTRQLPLHNREPLLNFGFVHTGAVAPKEELSHVRGDGVLSFELPDK